MKGDGYDFSCAGGDGRWDCNAREGSGWQHGLYYFFLEGRSGEGNGEA